MVANSEIYSIGGYRLPSPTSASVSVEDLELSAYRDAIGRVHRERARQGVRKVSFSYDILTQEELSELLPHLSATFFRLTYLDPEYGKHTIECYCSQKSGDLYSAILYNGLWRNVQFNCIER